MDNILTAGLYFFTAYMLGSLPMALWIGKVFYKKDIRNFGSGNPGATNAYRVLGWKAGISVFILDAGKGTLAVLPVFYSLFGIQDEYKWVGGIVVILGHVFSVFLKFKGGKGVATSCGVFICFSPLGALLGIIIFIVVLLAGRMVSLASICGSLALTLCNSFLFFNFEDKVSQVILILSILISLFVLVTHRSNIARILKNEEHKFGKAK